MCKCTPFEETRFVMLSCTRYITLLIDQTRQMTIFRSLTEVFSLETNLMSLLTDELRHPLV